MQMLVAKTDNRIIFTGVKISQT